MAQLDADQHKGRIAVRETAYYPGTVTDLPVEPFNGIVCEDASPVFTGKVKTTRITDGLHCLYKWLLLTKA